MNAVLQRDIDDLISMPLPWEQMRRKSVLITGASGLIGSMLVRTLACADRKYDLCLNITALTRSPQKTRLLFEEYPVHCLEGDVRDLKNCERELSGIDYIFHCAAVTKSADMVRFPAEVLLTAIEGTKNLLEIGRKYGLESMVFLSSMEMYGTQPFNPASPGAAGDPVTEDQLGYLCLDSPRTSYPEGKRAAECLCAAYSSEYKVPVKIARLAQTFGAGVSPEETRVFAQFARSALQGSDIVLHTTGASEGNYCYLTDTVCGLLTILLLGENGRAYNIANEDIHMTIRQMADLVAAQIAGGKIEVKLDLPDSPEIYGYAPETKLFLSSEKLRSLGWAPRYGMKEMYENMIACWQEDTGTP